MLQLVGSFWKCKFNYQLRDCSTEHVPKETLYLNATDDVVKDN